MPSINIRGFLFCNSAILCEIFCLNVGIILFFRGRKLQNLIRAGGGGGINQKLISEGVGGGGAYRDWKVS